jgi:hypothetical protein
VQALQIEKAFMQDRFYQYLMRQLA